MAEPLRVGKPIIRVGKHIVDMDELAFEQRAATCVFALRHDGKVLDVLHEFTRETICLGTVEHPIPLPRDGGTVGLTNTSSRLNKCLQYRLQIERRAADDLEHVGGRGLLLQGLAKFIEQARVLYGDDCLSGE